MKAILTMLPVAALFAAGCGDGANSALLPPTTSGVATDPGSLAGGVGNTRHHFGESIGGANGITDPAQAKADTNAIGSPEAAARLHGTQKVSYDSLGRILVDLGVDMGASDPMSAAQLYQNGGSALGMPIYANRVPEMITPSTSALTKEFDIYVAAAPEIAARLSTASKRCPGVKLVVSGSFTEDGVSCLLGKPARPEHLALANQLVTEATSPDIGANIAIATLLAAAHTSE
jgi:hypothetical protein